jgi:hypothetical protein
MEPFRDEGLMNKRLLGPIAASIVAFGIYGLTPSKAQDQISLPADTAQLTVDHSECTYFGPERERFNPRISRADGTGAGRLTRQFIAAAGLTGQEAGRTKAFTAAQAGSASTNLIDQYIFAALQANGVTPANKTTDYEFVRRVTLDLTGRIPTPAQVASFVSSTDPKKRATLVDQLLATPAWVDKWTMYYGDLFKNTASTVQVQIRPEGRNAF